MADIAIAVTPTAAQVGVNKFVIVDTGIDTTKLDMVRLMGLLYQLKLAFAGGVIKSTSNQVVMTVTIDGTLT